MPAFSNPISSSFQPSALPDGLLASLLDSSNPVASRFFAPLQEVLTGLTTTRVCPAIADPDWLGLGILRVLHDQTSGRGFLQQVGPTLESCPQFDTFFAAQRSARRLELCTEADALLRAAVRPALADRLAEVAELDSFEVYAGDGHWHKAAVHDKPTFPGGTKASIGHFYGLNLRHGTLCHITAADMLLREHEHDMRALKRQSHEALRMGATKGRKMLWVWDRAAISFEDWNYWKQRSGIYFLCREKEGLVLFQERELLWDRTDPRNAGLLGDGIFTTRKGVRVRRIEYQDPVGGEVYRFLTTEMTLPPGVLVELARRRWGIEKVFDVLKNKLKEQKAWGSSPEARTTQALFICMAHNLMTLFEQRIEREDGVRPEAELRRHAQRRGEEEQIARKEGLILPSLRAGALWLTQSSVKLLRWLRSTLFQQARWSDLLAILARSYAKL